MMPIVYTLSVEAVQLVNCCHPQSDVHVVKQDEVRAAILDERGTVSSVLFDGLDAVRARAIQPIRDEDATTNREDVRVQVMVDQAELLGWCQRTLGSIDFAGEGGVGRIVLVFPHHLELRKHEVGGGIGAGFSTFVDEDDNTFVGRDHLAEGGPVISGHDWVGRDVGKVRNTSLVENGLEGRDGDLLGVGEDQGEDFIRMPVEEELDFVEVVFNGTSVEEEAVRVTEVNFLAVHMGLSL